MTLTLDGKALSQRIIDRLRRDVDAASKGRPPGLGVILVGDNQASQVYVSNKEKAALKAGFVTIDRRLPTSASQGEVLDVIESFNKDHKIDGILLQLPLPKGLDANLLLDAILPAKDADGLHPFNQGLLQRGEGIVHPCTPAGAMRLIDMAYAHQSGDRTEKAEYDKADLSGKRAVVIGRSILVGKPLATMLLQRNATVTVSHSKTKDLPALVSEADIVCAAVGAPKLIKGDWIKKGAVVIDVGINRLPDGKLVGDVDFEEAKSRASAITPVPGGVGPMTIAMLLENTYKAFRLHERL